MKRIKPERSTTKFEKIPGFNAIILITEWSSTHVQPNN